MALSKGHRSRKNQGRYFRPKNKSIKGTPYDSLVEKCLHEGVLSIAEFHPDKINYVSHHTYQPDFVYKDSEGIEWLIEVKSIFQDSSEASKYKWIARSLGPDQSLVFVFENPNQKIHWQKERKDGTKMTLAEWATKNGFLWFTGDTIEKILI